MTDLPLNALRAFEVSARTGSFTAAAAELGVTAAAVSQQVKLLEDRLAKRLFDRQGNRIVLTDAGRAVYPRLESAFSDLAAVTSELRETQGGRPFVLSVLPSLADLWLMPRIGGLPDELAIEIRVEPDPVRFGREGADLRVTYGAQLYPDHRIVPLFGDRLVAVAGAGFPPGGVETVPDTRLVHTDWGPDFVRQPSWPAWFAAQGWSRKVDLRKGLRVGYTALAVAAVRGGAGVALAPERFVAADLADGTLRIAGPGYLPLPWDYVMVFPHAFERRRSLLRVTDHLRLAARQA
ncbi:MAG: LysR family transcriptional regulator [Paracoccaceae bacterium]